MPYQKDEKKRFGGFAQSDNYDKTSHEGGNPSFTGCIVRLFLIGGLVLLGYLFIQNHGGKVSLPSLPKFELGQKSEKVAPQVEIYDYQQEYATDSAFFAAHPRNPDFIPYDRANYEHFLVYSIENSARGLNFAIGNGDVAYIAQELEQLFLLSRYADVYRVYDEMFHSDLILDIMQMSIPTEASASKASAYDATYLLNLIRRKRGSLSNNLLVTADLFNALNSVEKDVVEQTLKKEFLQKNAIGVWRDYMTITGLSQKKTLLQGVLECPAFALLAGGEDDPTLTEQARECMLLIAGKMAEASRNAGISETDVQAFHKTAQKEIKSVLDSPKRRGKGFKDTQQAYYTHIARYLR